MEKHIIWSPNTTLGDVLALGINGNANSPEQFLTPGIDITLDNLTEKGFEHHIMNPMNVPIKTLLEKTELYKKLGSDSQIFGENYSGSQIPSQGNVYVDSKGKRPLAQNLFQYTDFAKVADALGMTHEEMAQNVVIIGEKPASRPITIPEIVTVNILDAYANQNSAEEIENAVSAVYEAGNGNIAKGFQELHSLAPDSQITNGLLEHRTYETENARWDIGYKMAEPLNPGVKMPILEIVPYKG